MNIIYISYDGMTDPLGQSQVIPYLIGLSQLGHTISIISCEKADKFIESSPVIETLLSRSNIHWIPVTYSSLPSVLSKKLNLFRIKKAATTLCQKKHVDVVHCRSYMAALIGLQLKHRFKIKFIFDMRGFWADERIDGEIWHLKNKLHKLIYKYFKKKEIEFLSNADYTICLTENAKKEILSWNTFINNSIPIEVIPCCADLELFSKKNINPKQQQELQRQLGVENSDFVISYLGSVGTWYMLDEMLDFFKCLITIKPNAKFLFITPDDKNDIFKKVVSKDIDSEKIIISSAKRAQVPMYLSLSAVSIYFIKPLYSKKASSPTKTAEIMGMGIPVITNKGIGDSDKIITDSNAGILVNEFTEKEYVRIINQIDVFLNADKEKIVNAANNYFSLKNGVRLYQSVYEKIKTKKENIYE